MLALVIGRVGPGLGVGAGVGVAARKDVDAVGFGDWCGVVHVDAEAVCLADARSRLGGNVDVHVAAASRANLDRDAAAVRPRGCVLARPGQGAGTVAQVGRRGAAPSWQRRRCRCPRLLLHGG